MRSKTLNEPANRYWNEVRVNSNGIADSQIYKINRSLLYRIAKDSLLVILYNGFFFICQL